MRGGNGQQPASQRARALLLADPAATDKALAEAAGVGKHTVRRVRLALEAAGAIPVRHTWQTHPPVWHVPDLPPQPELAGGLCTSHPQPDLWTSPQAADRAEARRVCRSCPLAVPCALWSLHLPDSDRAVYGGLTPAQRRAAKRRRRARAS
jgi:transcription factor WhiB